MEHLIKAIVIILAINSFFLIILNLPSVRKRDGYTYLKSRYILSMAMGIGVPVYIGMEYVFRFNSNLKDTGYGSAVLFGVVCSLFIMMVMREKWKTPKHDQSKRIVLKDHLSLYAIVQEVHTAFPGVSHHLIYTNFEPGMENDLYFSIWNDNHFTGHDDNFESRINPYISLEQIKIKAKRKDPDLKNTRLSWSKAELYILIQK